MEKAGGTKEHLQEEIGEILGSFREELYEVYDEDLLSSFPDAANKSNPLL